MKLKKFLAAVTAAVLAFVMAITVSASSDSTAAIKYSITIWYENKVNNESGTEPADMGDSQTVVKFGSSNNGYYANLYTYDDEYVCSVIIEDGKAVFNSNDIGHNYKVVIDKVSYGDEASDVSSAAGIIVESETI